MKEESKTRKFRGLTPLEGQVASLALSVSEMSEKLPSNLAKKFLNEVSSAASKSAKYYLNISGRKNYALEDTIEFIRDFPENTIFTHSDIKYRFHHHSSTIISALNKIYETNQDIDIVKISQTWNELYFKPSNTKVKLNTKYHSELKKYGLIASLSYSSDQDEKNLLELSRESMKEAEKIIKIENKRFRKIIYSIWDKEYSSKIALEILELAEKNIIQEINSELKEDGYIANGIGGYTFSHGKEPKIRIRDGRRKSIYKINVECIDSNSFTYGNDKQVGWSNFAKEIFENSGLINPVYPNGSVLEYKYDPKMIREARVRKYFSDNPKTD